jgi:hypothetical protein
MAGGVFSTAKLHAMTIRESATDGSDFTNPDADYRRLFLGEDGQLHVKDSAGAVTDIGSATTADHNHTAAGGDGGDLDAPVIDGYAIFNEEAAPSTPSAGTVAIYAKSDGRIYSKDDAGTEFGPFDAAGGAGGPLLIVDDLALHADGDEFDDDQLPGWTLAGGLALGAEVTAVTTEPYDATCLDVILDTQGARMYKACPGGDFTAYLTWHGITNATSPNDAAGGMMALTFTDTAGTGTGMSVYNDGSAYMWAVASHVYSGSGNVIASSINTGPVPLAASDYPVVYRLAKVGSTITGGISFNGGATWKTNTRSDSTTFTRMGLTRLFSGGAATNTMRVGRFNVVV